MQRYQHIANDIEKRIESGEIWEKLPTFREMIREYNTCIRTMTQVTDRLKVRGVIYSKPGVGYYVKKRVSG